MLKRNKRTLRNRQWKWKGSSLEICIFIRLRGCHFLWQFFGATTASKQIFFFWSLVHNITACLNYIKENVEKVHTFLLFWSVPLSCYESKHKIRFSGLRTSFFCVRWCVFAEFQRLAQQSRVFSSPVYKGRHLSLMITHIWLKGLSSLTGFHWEFQIRTWENAQYNKTIVFLFWYVMQVKT